MAELPDEDVPMASVPKTGDAGIMGPMAAALASLMGLFGLCAPKKREDD